MTGPYWQPWPQDGEPWNPSETVPYPEDPKPPKWPWVVAAASVLAVLAIALTSIMVITHRTETAAPVTVTVTPSTTWAGPNDVPIPTTTEPPPTPSAPGTSISEQTAPPTTEAPVEPTIEAPVPAPSTGSGPGGSGTGAKSVTYSAGGSGPIPGSVIQSITVSYMTDTEMVTVHDVSLPWAATVTREDPGKPLIMTVSGGNVSCAISVDGVTVASNAVADFLASCNASL